MALNYVETRGSRRYFRLVLDPFLASCCGRKAIRYALAEFRTHELRRTVARLLAAVDYVRQDLLRDRPSVPEASKRLAQAVRDARMGMGSIATSPLSPIAAATSVLVGASASCDTAVPDVMLGQAISEFLAEKSASVSPATIRDEYAPSLREFLQFMGERRLASIARRDLVAYRDWFAAQPANARKLSTEKARNARRVSPRTVEKRLTRIGTFFNWTVEVRHIVASPCTGMAGTVAAAPQHQRRGYTDEEARRVLERCSGDRQERLLLLMAMYTGCRLKELTGLHLADIEQGDGGSINLHIRPHLDRRLKTAASERVLPLSSRIVRDVADWLAQRKNKPMFDVNPKAFSKRYGRILRSLGLPRELCFHSWRHAVAEQLRARGVATEVIAAILGHKGQATITDAYAKQHALSTFRNALEQLQWPTTSA